jgi:hypothetical protein
VSHATAAAIVFPVIVGTLTCKRRYRAGDGARAKALGEKGRWHNAQMQQVYTCCL